jgi:hypothetical protein
MLLLNMPEDVLDSTCFPYYGPIDRIYAIRDAKKWASSQGGGFEIKKVPLGLCKGFYRAVVYKD